METKRDKLLILVLGLVGLTAGNQQFMSLTPGLVRKSENACKEVARVPYFLPDKVIGRPWRVYYTWNMKMDNDKCVDIHFQTATPAIIRRIYYDMNRSMMEQPAWEEASLLMTTGRLRQEMLLIPQTDTIGRFYAVPNDFSDVMPGGQVPLLRFQMKLMREGQFLVFIDCHVGIAWLAARFDQEPPYRMDVDNVALKLVPFLGEGNHACTSEKNLLEYHVEPSKEKPNQQSITYLK